MRTQKTLPIAFLIASTLLGGTASAETSHAVGRAEMQAAITAKRSDQASQRAAIQSLLARSEVRELAANSGLDLARATAVASTLEGAELERLAAQAATCEAELTGGETTIVLTTTLLLIILIIVLLVA